jgi:hypothetical protein
VQRIALAVGRFGHSKGFGLWEFHFELSPPSMIRGAGYGP